MLTRAPILAGKTPQEASSEFSLTTASMQPISFGSWIGFDRNISPPRITIVSGASCREMRAVKKMM